MKRKASESSDSDSDSDGLQDIVNVDFDFYNPEQIDFHALKRLLGQLFSTDAELINIGDIVDILLEENHVGTTVKVDGQESDPYAILSVINMTHFKCPKKESSVVEKILSPDSDKHVGWVVSERFINMPFEVMPPMYTMMQDETKQAKEKGEPYDLEWYMFIAKTYKEVEPVVDKEGDEEEQKEGQQTETFYYQPEDEVISKYAEHQFDFKFTNREKESSSDARRAFSDFGIAPARRLMFVHRSKFDELIEDIKETCSAPAS
ncbi:p21-C-terminal region-binding protein-domain-containing protein [Dichotomocladium elegans]|nr:p21-C-terminal region-binding protein-domain-containing protein [Dichotomocladium elegans]